MIMDCLSVFVADVDIGLYGRYNLCHYYLSLLPAGFASSPMYIMLSGRASDFQLSYLGRAISELACEMWKHTSCVPLLCA